MEGCRQYICSATEFPIQMTCPNRPPGITALGPISVSNQGSISGGSAAGIYLKAGGTVAMLMFPKSVLEPLWQLNFRAHEGFAAMGLWAVLLVVYLVTKRSAFVPQTARRWQLTRLPSS